MSDGILNRLPHEIDSVRCGLTLIRRHQQVGPSNNIDIERRNLIDLAVLDRNKRCALGTALPDMSALKIATECDMRPLVQNCGLVDMGHRPVIVALVDQILDGARRIIKMASHATQPRVQDTDIEATGRRQRISGDEVLSYVALPETLAVECNGIALQQKCCRASRRKDMDVRREDEAARDLTFRVMIAVEQEHRSSSLREPAHLPDEEQSGLVIAPITIIEVTGDDDEGDLFFNRLADQVIEGDARCGPDSFSGCALLPGKSLKRTIEMNVAGVNEAKGFQWETPYAKSKRPSPRRFIRFTGRPSFG